MTCTNGNVTAAGGKTFSYDSQNELVSMNGGAVQVMYDGDGNPIVFEDANTHTTSESFDLLGELSAKTLPDQALTETRTYDANGNLQTIAHFNGVTTT